MGNGSVNGEAAEPRAAASLSNCHLRHSGGGVQGRLLSFLASELERPQKGEKCRESGTRDREKLSASVCVCACVCVQVCKCVCICVSFQRAGGGDSPDRGALSSCPCTGLFSSQAINVTAASKAG